MSESRAEFPAGGASWEVLSAEMRSRSGGDIDWQNGKAPLFVFGNDRETYEVGRRAFFEFFSENALGRKRAFFGLASMERDVLDYGLSLLNAPDGAEGAFTTGGSESLFIAMKAARGRTACPGRLHSGRSAAEHRDAHHGAPRNGQGGGCDGSGDPPRRC